MLYKCQVLLITHNEVTKEVTVELPEGIDKATIKIEAWLHVKDKFIFDECEVTHIEPITAD